MTEMVSRCQKCAFAHFVWWINELESSFEFSHVHCSALLVPRRSTCITVRHNNILSGVNDIKAFVQMSNYIIVNSNSFSESVSILCWNLNETLQLNYSQHHSLLFHSRNTRLNRLTTNRNTRVLVLSASLSHTVIILRLFSWCENGVVYALVNMCMSSNKRPRQCKCMKSQHITTAN